MPKEAKTEAAEKSERRRCARISAIVEHDEGNALFIPIVLTSCGGCGPSAQKFLKHIYKKRLIMAKKKGAITTQRGKGQVV